MLDPRCAMSVEELEAFIADTTGHEAVVEAGVRPYVNLLTACGVVTTSCCEGHDGGMPWVLYDRSSADESEVMAILRAAQLCEGVEISEGHTYEMDGYTLHEGRIRFQRKHPSTDEIKERNDD